MPGPRIGAGVGRPRRRGSASIPTYEGLVATRCRQFTRITSNQWSQARTPHIATDAIAALRVCFGHFYTSSYLGALVPADTGLAGGASGTIKAAIEYPVGTFNQLLFSGNVSGVVANNSIMFSDVKTLSVPIPAGATFYVRWLWNCASGSYMIQGQSSGLGEQFEVSVSAPLTDKTMGGTLGTSGAGFQMPPLAILGQTTKPSVIILGDSIGAGFGNDNNHAPQDGKMGVIARGLGGLPFLNLSLASERANSFIAAGPNRKLLIPFCSHLITQYGTNDFGAAQTDAQLKASLQSIWALKAPHTKVYQATLCPRTTSTDSWATEASQTVSSGGTLGQIPGFNTDVRNIAIPGQHGFYEVRTPLESAPGSNKWAVNGAAFHSTPDGLHPSITAGGYPAVGAYNAAFAASLSYP